MKSIQSTVSSVISDFIGHSPENTLRNQAGDQAFVHPLIGFSRGDDPIFEQYKHHVGPFHWTPHDIFRLTFPTVKADPEELAVISWALPHNPLTKADNRRQDRYPSEKWARARHFGEEVNNRLRKYLVQKLAEKNIAATAPMLSPLWSRETSDTYGYSSKWSERHIAHASGLGAFGLCDGLITERGKAVRAGSVVAKFDIPSVQRPYTDHHAYCLFYSKGVCGKCIGRCPAGAISEKGHDKSACSSYIRDIIVPYIRQNFGFETTACGLCQTKVPCESGIPLSDM